MSIILNLIAFLRKLSVNQWLVIGVVAVFSILSIRLKVEHNLRLRAEAEQRISQIALLNAQALRDTTLKITKDSIKLLGDSLVLYQRQVVQEKQKTTDLDHKLGLLQVINYNLTLKIDTLKETIRSTQVTDSADSLRASFAVNQTPYHVRADVALPKTVLPGSTGRLTLGITQDALKLNVHVGCGAKGQNGVRPAVLNVLSPPYATVRLDSLTQAIEVCSPPPAPLAPSASFWGKVWGIVKVSGAAIGGYLIGRSL
jgi:hypothetical protein